MDEKLYLVTGAAGFVGGYMVRLLSEKGLRVPPRVCSPSVIRLIKK